MKLKAVKRVYNGVNVVGVLLNNGNWYRDEVLVSMLKTNVRIVGLGYSGNKLTGNDSIALSDFPRVAMSRITPRTERYKIYENERHVGFFNVNYSMSGRTFTADLMAPSQAFVLMPDKDGHVTDKKIQSWLVNRIVPPTRVGINELLQQMGLSEYDQLSILKYTSARHASDTCRIDFSTQV